MALVFSLKEGQDFFVGEARFVIAKIDGASKFDIEGQGCLFHITDTHATEIMPQVMVSAGDDTPTAASVRVVVSAPRRITVLRGDRRRASEAMK